tara:strand:+ start:466 stop:900 length:435 start_codon:yes stop_codon:yes gene_type:complete
MTDYITTHEGWLTEYRKDKTLIWVRVVLSNGREIYFADYKTWLSIKKLCVDEKLSVSTVRLQYKSHVETIDASDAEAVYLVRSIMGQVGGESKNYYTIGKLIDGVVLKSRWLTPELVEEEKIEDSLDNCFEEAIIYDHARKTNR